jgi:hypothetical protein
VDGGNLGQIQWIHWKIAMMTLENYINLSSKALPGGALEESKN